MSTTTKAKPTTEDREIITSRLINAPRELVWTAWTDPKHITQWWGPNGFSTTTKEFDLRAGGTWRFTMHGPDGRDYPNRILFSEVLKPERLVYQHAGEDDFDHIHFEAYVTFEVDGSKTKVTLHSLFATKQERDYVVKEHGAVEGAQQTLGRLDEFVTTKLKNSLTVTLPSDTQVCVERVFNAPQELVFDAWTEPRHIPHWMGFEDWTMRVLENDLRPGGVWRYAWSKTGEAEMEMHGTFKEIKRPEKLVTTENWGEPWPEAINTLELKTVAGKTHLRLTITYPSKEARDAAIATGMNDGMAVSFDRLESYLAGMRV